MNKRVQAFLAKMQEKELDGIIINNLKNVYYFSFPTSLSSLAVPKYKHQSLA